MFSVKQNNRHFNKVLAAYGAIGRAEVTDRVYLGKLIPRRWEIELKDVQIRSISQVEGLYKFSRGPSPTTCFDKHPSPKRRMSGASKRPGRTGQSANGAPVVHIEVGTERGGTMTVTGADISLSASHTSKQTYKREESLLVGFTKGDEGFSADTVSNGRRITRAQEQAEAFSDDSLLDQFQRGENFNTSDGTRIEYLSAFRALQAEFSNRITSISTSALLPSMAKTEAVESTVPVDISLSAKDRARIELIVTLVEKLTGKRIRMSDPDEFLERRTADSQLDPFTSPLTQVNEPASEQAENVSAFGLRYSYKESYSESETTTFSATGLIRTADGEEISIDISVTMSRSFSAEISETVELGSALKDPLVINFSGAAVELTERTFQFDIDADGMVDQIHFVKPGSGFLALDRNGDGEINDGSELFGTQSGDGFGDLAAYDEDGNGFIDEGDTIFERLRVFIQDGAGNRQLLALGATGVEAIYLGHVSTPFEIKNERNELQGVVRETGLYVGKDGAVGTVQQIDLVV